MNISFNKYSTSMDRQLQIGAEKRKLDDKDIDYIHNTSKRLRAIRKEKIKDKRMADKEVSERGQQSSNKKKEEKTRKMKIYLLKKDV